MTSKEIRQKFLDFFEDKKHKIIDSAPVVPYDDPTLLFTNAGMNQFKDVFLNQGSREYSRAADTQKCIRVSGKHNDLEEVGYDTYHHTFFEMLGNWSFGDYYKEEAITWAWELLTDVFGLPKERLWATVYKTDDEAFDIWKSKTDIDQNHILRFGEKDNFWEMGDTGPCGPCSEIHINLSDDLENPELVNSGVEEVIEIWNLVFIQYNRDVEGNLHDLPKKHIDTGMGFERLVRVLQKKNSNYDTDVFKPLIDEVELISGSDQTGEDNLIAMRVIADHIRTLTFAIGDGAIPGNEGRGYVLRRILRRAARYGRKINLKEPFLYMLVDNLAKNMGGVFPEIVEKKENIKKIIKAEEESFNATLDRGLSLFEEISVKAKDEKKEVIGGSDVFKLYDTFGFPVDLTNVLAKEKGLSIDEAGFDKLMDEQKERARKSTKEKIGTAGISAEDITGFFNDDSKTIFTGYEELESKSKILAIKKEHDKALIVLDRTPFYAESGGQVSDKGEMISNGKIFEVADVLKIRNQFVHVVEDENSELKLGAEVLAKVDSERRWDIMRNHSVTHFLHAALREVLGSHVQQAGSYVGPERLRFDFSHFEKLSKEETAKIENIVNFNIRKNYPLLHHKNIPFEEAKKMDALMFFGDKYGESVNVVQFGDYTKEFCGGTHVQNGAQIGLFKIISETSIASGVRRIEAVTGAGVEKFILQKEEEAKRAEERISELLDEKKKLEKEIAELRFKEKAGGIDKVISFSITVKGVNVFKGRIDAANMDELKQMGDEMRNKIKSGVGVLISEFDGKVGIVAVVSDDLIQEKKLGAGKVVSDVAKIVGGGGGGRNHLAAAGGRDVAKIDDALEAVEEVVGKYLNE